jgi:hypothetical protein
MSEVSALRFERSSRAPTARRPTPAGLHSPTQGLARRAVARLQHGHGQTLLPTAVEGHRARPRDLATAADELAPVANFCERRNATVAGTSSSIWRRRNPFCEQARPSFWSTATEPPTATRSCARLRRGATSRSGRKSLRASRFPAIGLGFQ